MAYATIRTEVDVDVDEVLESLDQEEIRELLAKHSARDSESVPPGFGKGDKSLERVIEDAFLAAKAMPIAPEPIRILFDRVFGRVMA